MWDAVGVGIMTAGGTTDTTLADIVVVGDMKGTREAMATRVMDEAILTKDTAERTRAVDIAVEKASMVEAGSTAEVDSTVAAGSMEVDAAKR